MSETEKKTWGGKRREGVTKTSLQVTLDTDLVEWIDSLGGKRATQINKMLRQQKERLDSIEKAAKDFSDIY
jgi:uncharacterized protein (DUF4415 family)